MLVSRNGTQGLISQHGTACCAVSSPELTTTLARFRERRGVVRCGWGLAALALLCVFPLLAAPVQAQQATNPLLPEPVDVSAVPLLPGQIRLGWWRNFSADPDNLVDSHQYRYRVHSENNWVDWTTVNQTMVTPPGSVDPEIRNYNKVFLNGLTAGTTYEFSVRSVDRHGDTSAPVSALGTAVGQRTVGIARPIRSVQEGQPLHAVSRAVSSCRVAAAVIVRQLDGHPADQRNRRHAQAARAHPRRILVQAGLFRGRGHHAIGGTGNR